MQQRIASIIEEYDRQGIHRTGTAVDIASAEWLAARIQGLGVTPHIDTFTFKRIEVKAASFTIPGATIDGVPLYDCGYTDAAGISGTVGEIGSIADIGIAMGLSDAALLAARKQSTHRAIVMVTDPRMPADGVATLNAESFRAPFGPPVLQVPSQDWPHIQRAMQGQLHGKLVAAADYVPATASNVQATVAGTDPSLAPLVVMTPRSGWWSCASERGGGIASFLEIMRAVKTTPVARPVIFTANTGHELGHTGLDHYLEANGALVRGAYAWIHLGANFAARHGAGVRLQYSDETLQKLVLRLVANVGARPATETPIGTRPSGEARNIHDGGGRFVSILGSNGLFHHPADRYPDAVDLAVTTQWVDVLVALAMKLAAGSGDELLIAADGQTRGQ